MDEINKYTLVKFPDGNIGFDIDILNPPISLIDKVNAIAFQWQLYAGIVKIDGYRAIFDNRYIHLISHILPHLGYTWTKTETKIWNKDEDPSEIECQKLHLIKID